MGSTRSKMPIIFDRVNPDTTLETITEFEKEWDISLPEDYKQFLLNTNGGRGRKNWILYIDEDRIDADSGENGEMYATVDEVFGLHSPNGDLYTVDLHTANIRVNQDVGGRTSCLPDTIVIADDGSGHYYFGIVTSESRYGECKIKCVNGVPV